MSVLIEKEIIREGVCVTSTGTDVLGLIFSICVDNITGVYVGSRADGLVYLYFCRANDNVGHLAVPNDQADDLIARFIELGVYLENEPAMKSTAC